MKTFVQIGTHNGNDEFNIMVKNYKPDLIILVEPNKDMNYYIHSMYKDVKNYFIENVAINTTAGPCKLVYPINHFTGINFSSLHFSLLPMDDWGNNLQEINCNGITFMDLCEKYNISNIDYLQIDTEGFDSEIILSIDFEKIKVKKIIYEWWGFDKSAFTRHGDQYKNYGIDGMNLVEKKLKSLNFTLNKVTDSFGTINIEAILNDNN
jgi:FkbM family methyltransferase